MIVKKSCNKEIEDYFLILKYMHYENIQRDKTEYQRITCNLK